MEREQIFKMPLDDGTTDYVYQCRDCGAFMLNGKPEDVRHYPNCAPSNPTWFED